MRMFLYTIALIIIYLLTERNCQDFIRDDEKEVERFLDGPDLSPHHAQLRMVKGSTTRREDWKFIVFILWVNKKNKATKCGGTLLSKQWILTARHCLLGKPNTTRVHLKIGSFHYKNDGVRMTSYIQYPYPHFRILNEGKSALGDVALIKLDNKIQFSQTIQPVRLITHRVAPGTHCKVAGWGVSIIININTPHETLEKPDGFLREVDLEIADPAACAEIFGQEAIDQTVLCTRSVYGDEFKTPFYGDSGGPLICGGAQAGIICAAEYQQLEEGKAYALYMFVPKYFNWINKIMEKDRDMSTDRLYSSYNLISMTDEIDMRPEQEESTSLIKVEQYIRENSTEWTWLLKIIKIFFTVVCCVFILMFITNNFNDPNDD